jgi:prevent-host-death family protein
MPVVASRDLRNHTADVLRQVAEGARITVTVNGVPVAEIGPVQTTRRTSLPKNEFLALLAHRQADPGLDEDLRLLAADTTDDLGPIR